MPIRLHLLKTFWPVGQKIRGLYAIESVACIFLLILLSVYPDLVQARAVVRSGVVTRVVDGDTVWVRTATPSQGARGGGILKVRILGIDAPEICQPGGPEALATLRDHVLGQTVTLNSPSHRSHDDYGRVLASLDKQGEDVGRSMVRRGQAWSYGYRRDPGPYAAEQIQARSAGVGLFAQADAESPRSFRKRHGSCHPRTGKQSQ